MAMRRGKIGVGLPAIIWNAGIMSSRLATIEIPGAIATRASRSMMMPKERVRRLPISQPSVKWSLFVDTPMYEGAHKLDIYERLSRSRYFVGAR